MRKYRAVWLCICLVFVLAACRRPDVYGLTGSGAGTYGEGADVENAAGQNAGDENADGGTGSGRSENQVADDAADSRKEKMLAVQIGPEPETIDPALNSTVDGANMIMTAFEPLLLIDEDGDLAPGQAQTYEISEDGLTWTFHLRDGLQWSDGTPLTAQDFVYSWRRLCDPSLSAPYARTVLGMVSGFEETQQGRTDALAVSAPDDRTFVVRLSAPCPYFAKIAAFSALCPVKKQTVEENKNQWAQSPETYISNGAFYVSEWVPGAYLVMKKNPCYWDADEVRLDSLKFMLTEDADAAYAAYEAGEILLVKDIPEEKMTVCADRKDFYKDTTLGTYFISLNNGKAPLSDVRVRKALGLAIDREYIAKTVMQGFYEPAYHLVGPKWPDCDGTEFISNTEDDTGYISDDPEKNIKEAKQLLAQAGYPDGEGLPVLTYTTNDRGWNKAVAEYLKQAWEAVGIRVNIEFAEWSEFTARRREGEYELSRNGWMADYNDPVNLLELFYSSDGNNEGNYSSDAFDAAIERSAAALDPAERSAALHEAESILLDDMGCIPVAYYTDFWLQSPKVRGLWHSVNGYWVFTYADVRE